MNCIGVIFHFNPDGVLFEFSANKKDDAVGIVKPKDIKINSKETIPENATTIEQISKFLQVGDELLCRVEQKGNIEKFVYNEEEEEMSSDGQTTTVSRKVEIQPRWIATSAELVTDANRSKRDEYSSKTSAEKSLDELEYDDVLIIEDFDMSDFEEEKKKSDEGVTLSDDTARTKPPNSTKSSVVPAAASAAAPRQIIKISAPAQNKVEELKAFYQTFFDKARLVQLRKPPFGSTGKVTTAIFEIATGKFRSRKVSVPSLKMFVFGHQLTSANLMLHLKYGEECTVEYRVVKLKASQDFLADLNNSDKLVEVPLVVNLWFGKQMNVQATPTDKDLMAWLNKKKISNKEFQNWIKNWVSPKVSETKLKKQLLFK